MPGLFGGLFAPKVMYHAELPARERIVRVFDEQLVPHLEPLGFVFDRKEILFRRERANFTDTIDHQIGHRNSTPARIVCFRPSYSVRCKSFARWQRVQLDWDGEGLLFSGNWTDLKPTHSYGYDSHSYDLGRTDNQRLMEAYRNALVQELIPIMDTTEPIANAIPVMKRMNRMVTPVQIYLACMVGRKQEAREALAEYDAHIRANYAADEKLMRGLERCGRMVAAM